jgi:hypothetical protein
VTRSIFRHIHREKQNLIRSIRVHETPRYIADYVQLYCIVLGELTSKLNVPVPVPVRVPVTPEIPVTVEVPGISVRQYRGQGERLTEPNLSRTVSILHLWKRS